VTAQRQLRAAVVTGAGSGIGRACARRLAADGFAVIVNDISADSARQTAAMLAAAGGTARVVAGDVGDERVLVACVAAATADFWRLDAVVNNAGYGRPGTVAGTSDDLLDEMVSVNVKGVLHGMRAAFPVMAAQGGGSIVNIASTAALAAAADRAAYGAAKSAVVALTRSAAVENARHGIRVNAVCPGPIHTPALERFVPDFDFYRRQLPMGRPAQADEIAGVVSFLVGPDSSYVSGVALPVDGAMGARLPAPARTSEELLS
jgi:NAD(P)-dependent dehydrogenase (short-subunit alcohol dehydrogenase family)